MLFQELFNPTIWSADSTYEVLAQIQRAEMDKREKDRREKKDKALTVGPKGHLAISNQLRICTLDKTSKIYICRSGYRYFNELHSMPIKVDLVRMAFSNLAW